MPKLATQDGFFLAVLAGDYRDCVGDAAGFLQDGFLGLLDEHFVDNADHLSAVELVKRAATVTGVGCGVELKDIIGRGKPD